MPGRSRRRALADRSGSSHHGRRPRSDDHGRRGGPDRRVQSDQRDRRVRVRDPAQRTLTGPARAVPTAAMTARVTPEPGARPVVVLISVTWAGPSRPAPTVLRELSRRWGREIREVLLEDPDDEVLDQLEIELGPTRSEERRVGKEG